MQHVIIIGNGISGITAARHIRKQSDKRITVISGESDFFFSRTALMYVFMGHMKFEHTKPYEDHFWKKNRIDLLKGWVQSIDFEQKTIHLENQKLTYDQLILATGSRPNMFDWPGQNLKGVQGLYSLQDLENLEALESKIDHAVVVGGGLIGVELAEMLASRGKKVSFLVREKNFWNAVLPLEESQMLGKHILEHHIDLRFETELAEIIGNETDEVVGIKLKSGEIIDCQFVGLAVGVRPNIDFLKNTTLKINRGIEVDEFLTTNIPDVYAIGDCAEHLRPAEGRKSLEQIWYTGRQMGVAVAKTICGVPSQYNPGVFFNSAKFFDVEYQTYGSVPAVLNDDTTSFFWQHELKNILVRINYNTASKAVTGVNTFGIRMRHEVWQQWLEQPTTIEYVLQHLKLANFDPEFFKEYEAEILKKFNKETGANLALKSKKGLAGVIKALFSN